MTKKPLAENRDTPKAPIDTSQICSDYPNSPASGETVKSCCEVRTNPEFTPDCEFTPGGEAKAKRKDWLLWVGVFTTTLLVGLYFLDSFAGKNLPSSSLYPFWLRTMTHTSVEMVGAMWWGVLLGAACVGFLQRVPQAAILRIFGLGGTFPGILRATGAGVLLDLCNHGILMIAMQLYQKGVSLGQVMAFLIASPWNSLTLTLILVGLIGLPLTLSFVLLSMCVAMFSGWLFDHFVDRGVLPRNPKDMKTVEPMSLTAALQGIRPSEHLTPKALLNLIWQGLKSSTMVLRWVLFGIVLVALIRAFMPEEVFSTSFGPTLSGLAITLVAATLFEVCSEGSSPIAADLVNRAQAPGNGFVFLMAGASTDYTEIMSLKDTTASWKIALFLPLITVPQIVLLGYLLNFA